MKKILMVISLLAIVLDATADTYAIGDGLGGRFMLTGGFTAGGDKVATIEFEDGDTADVRAGGEFLLGAGVDYRFSPNWELQLTLNYQVDREKADNGDASFHRMPIDLLGFYSQGPHRFGGGLTYHMNSEFETDFDDFDENSSVDFDDALGLVLEYDYFVSEALSLGVRYTDIEYKVTGSSQKIDGSYVGLMMNIYF
ncbi:MAG: outer membrane beta-barrel protein [Spongiibacteraceae bacterium]